MWQGEILKAITFPVTVTRDAPQIWEAVTGARPDNSAKRGLPPPLLSTASGVWRDFQLNVFVQSNRIEANITALDPNPNKPIPIPPIPEEDFEKALMIVRELAVALTADAPLLRMGAAAQLVRRVETYEAGVKQLNAELDGVFPSQATDAVHQFNVRRPLSAGAGEMNRLCKWGVSTVGTLGVTIDQTGNVSRVPMEDDAATYSFLHLDINNVPFTVPASANDCARVARELWDEVVAIRDGGIDVLT